MFKIKNAYDINYLIERFSDKYKDITGNSNSGKFKTIIKAPEIQSFNKKIFIQNFKDVCASINRDLQEVSSYISKELVVQTSISANGTLVIHGTYRKNQIESIVKKYVINFVQCPLCKTQDTKIEKNNRINYIICNRCHAKSSIS
jgi:translation initiation factor 2 subunit 2